MISIGVMSRRLSIYAFTASTSKMPSETAELELSQALTAE
jgi:hypothetical protein